MISLLLFELQLFKFGRIGVLFLQQKTCKLVPKPVCMDIWYMIWVRGLTKRGHQAKEWKKPRSGRMSFDPMLDERAKCWAPERAKRAESPHLLKTIGMPKTANKTRKLKKLTDIVIHSRVLFSSCSVCYRRYDDLLPGAGILVGMLVVRRRSTTPCP